MSNHSKTLFVFIVNEQKQNTFQKIIPPLNNKLFEVGGISLSDYFIFL